MRVGGGARFSSRATSFSNFRASRFDRYQQNYCGQPALIPSLTDILFKPRATVIPGLRYVRSTLYRGPYTFIERLAILVFGSCDALSSF